MGAQQAELLARRQIWPAPMTGMLTRDARPLLRMLPTLLLLATPCLATSQARITSGSCSLIQVLDSGLALSLPALGGGT